MRNMKIYIFLIAAILIIFLYLALIKTYWTPEWDSAYFISIARSILNGNGFTYLGYEVTKIPPGFPIMLLPILALKGMNFTYMNAFIVLLALASLITIFLIFKNHFSSEYSLAIVFLSAISPILVVRSLYIMSDIPYLLFSMLTIYFIDKSFRKQFQIKYCLIIGIFIALCVLIRTIGISLIAAYLLLLLIKRDLPRKTSRGIIVMAIIFSVVLFTISAPKSGQTLRDENLSKLTEFSTYKDEILRKEYDEPYTRINPGLFALRIIKNSLYYGGETATLMSSLPIKPSMKILANKHAIFNNFPMLLFLGIIFLIILIGYINDFISGPYYFDIYIVFYIGIQLALSAREARYLVVLLPFLFHYFLTGIRTIISKLTTLYKNKVTNIAIAVYLLFFGSFNIYKDFRIVNTVHKIKYFAPDHGNQENVRNFIDAIEWVKIAIPTDSKIISVMAPWVVLLADKWCISFPKTTDQTKITNFILNVSASYLIVAPLVKDHYIYITPIIDNNPKAFSILFESGRTRIYKINKEFLIPAERANINK